MQYMSISGTLDSWKTILGWNYKTSGTKTLTFINVITTMLYGSEIRAVEIEYILLLLTSANGAFLFAGENNTILLTFTLVRGEK